MSKSNNKSSSGLGNTANFFQSVTLLIVCLEVQTEVQFSVLLPSHTSYNFVITCVISFDRILTRSFTFCDELLIISCCSNVAVKQLIFCEFCGVPCEYGSISNTHLPCCHVTAMCVCGKVVQWQVVCHEGPIIIQQLRHIIVITYQTFFSWDCKYFFSWEYTTVWVGTMTTYRQPEYEALIQVRDGT